MRAIQAVLPPSKKPFLQAGLPENRGVTTREEQSIQAQLLQGKLQGQEKSLLCAILPWLPRRAGRTEPGRDSCRAGGDGHSKYFKDRPDHFSLSEKGTLNNMLLSIGKIPVETQYGMSERLPHHAKNWELITKHCKGLPIRIYSHTLAGKETAPTALRHGTNQSSNGGGQGPPNKRDGVSAIREAECNGLLFEPVSNSQKDGEQRPVVNLKTLNEFVARVKFKMEGIHTLKDFIKPGDWLTRVDLKETYILHCTDPPLTQEVLRFVWKGSAYEFNCLPFGLSSAPWVFI